MNAPDLWVAALPPLMREIARACGVEAVRRLSARWGGTRLFVPLPEHLGPEHPIAATIGLEAALRLAALYGGEQGIDIARCARGARALRDAEIAQAGDTQRSLARQHGLTERQVRNIQRALREAAEDAQGGLF